MSSWRVTRQKWESPCITRSQTSKLSGGCAEYESFRGVDLRFDGGYYRFGGLVLHANMSASLGCRVLAPGALHWREGRRKACVRVEPSPTYLRRNDRRGGSAVSEAIEAVEPFNWRVPLHGILVRSIGFTPVSGGH
jgi:hypothetical protein